ncbi:MAG TPA: RNA polymerase sigma factor [Spirochaetota bacterium]|jgi:RNA polymerase sigma-70 factor (ECF subfamily)|nr:RNA polymerase sigma factor [Spirochaetota bacterium]HON15903.1 RNA polymerase sigma factor [Spirochaetota bacterium]HPD78199.1 RNA polymerase sigma factor [Spirochaetota bacterium]HRU66092.1 RNA polymerase sigma factor [Spirochaetota bacterium]
MISKEEIEKAYNNYSKEIFAYILKSVHNHEEAEDILQDVFVRLINYSIKENVTPSNIRSLLYSIARTICIDNARKKSKTPTIELNTSEIPFYDANSKEGDKSMADIVNSIIPKFAEPEKTIIILRQNGLTYQEISHITKISERTLKRKVKKIIEEIRKILTDEGFIIVHDTISKSDSLNN